MLSLGPCVYALLYSRVYVSGFLDTSILFERSVSAEFYPSKITCERSRVIYIYARERRRARANIFRISGEGATLPLT